MARLEDIKNGAMVGGIAPNQPVEVVSVEWIGDHAINVVYRDLLFAPLLAFAVCYRTQPGQGVLNRPGFPASTPIKSHILGRFSGRKTRFGPNHVNVTRPGPVSP